MRSGIGPLSRFDIANETRYTLPMTSSISLPPHLERFVHEQIAAGRFHTEGELIRAALQLLEESSSAVGKPSSPWETAKGATLRQPAALEKWEVLRERSDSAGTNTTKGSARRNLRGLLADLRSDISFDDIKEARTEMWSGEHRDGLR